MTAVPLTKSLIDQLKNAKTDYTVWDSKVGGLGIRVAPSGRKTFVLYYRAESGKQRKPTIGRYGAITLDQARSIAREWLGLIARGFDISKERQVRRSAETVEQLSRRFLTEYVLVHKKPRSAASDQGLIENHIIPLLGDISVRALTRNDVATFRDKVAQGATRSFGKGKRPRGRRSVKGGKGCANRALACLSKMMSCAVEWGIRDDNPVFRVKRFREFRSERFLSKVEVTRLLKAIDEAIDRGGPSLAATLAIKLILLTGARAGEVQFLRWNEVDLDARVIRLTDSKSGPKLIALSAGAAELLRTAKLRLGTNSEFVFPSANGLTAVELRRPWHAIRHSAELGSDVTLHTLRHTFASHAVMNGLTLPQIGALLGHRSVQTTLRYADHAHASLLDYADRASEALY